MEERVTFVSEGLKLAGFLHRPDGAAAGERRPALAVLHGFGSNKDGGVALAAARLLASWGYVALRFDMRGCGESDGPRGRVILQRPFVPHWDPVEVIVERDGRREVHRIGGANHFLHLVEHFEQCIIDPWKDLFPAEDGVANVAACNLVRRVTIEA